MKVKSLKNIFVTLFTVYFFSIGISFATSSFTPFKMVFLPNINLSFQKTDNWIMKNESLVIMQDMIKSINDNDSINLVILGGNLTENQDGELSDLPSFLDTISGLNKEYYVILGNNEANLSPDLSKQYFCAEFRRHGPMDISKTYWSQAFNNNVLLIGLDTSIINQNTGTLPPEELLWLENILSNNTDKFTIILMHHSAMINNLPPNPMFKISNTIDNAQSFLSIINKYPQVKMILSGNTYNYSVFNANQKIFLTLPSITTYPNEYKIITVSPDKISIETEPISFKQIIKKAKKHFLLSKYSLSLGFLNNKSALKYQNSKKYKKIKEIYFK